ncbi:Cyclic di-GMP phosphodiesterase response regulator RpfG [Paraliobacillus sp. PM-2]|uniref:HD-GYP domain-containing protein n=1 Tax=Paraliobacillus sp. PM-2 TaxID=1462524 RepID=UPI00061CAE03|nr:HD-GYP domain-containing protein [Paraliobacillus sp. PM-2]CQR47425.1 Cyclic di-GMP phosphodiesterase response regulator RpfG [Paraliobacillus sp. PM-2]
MNKITQEKEQLLKQTFKKHNQKLNHQIFKISFIYIMLSIIWNTIFGWLNLPFSRASVTILLVCISVWLILFFLFRFMTFSPHIIKHIVLLFVMFVIVCLYFGSGYTESWSYFLLVPIINSLYSDRTLSIIYSVFGMLCLAAVSIYFPINSFYIDSIDISNRILLYIIVATFSYLLLTKLYTLHNKQVNTIIHSMEMTIEQVVQSFIVAVEAKDQYTFGHSERVSQYAVALAKQLPAFQEEQKLKYIRLSGLIHDIGKINIPEQILTKPTRLTDKEYEIIKTHTTFGAQMVEKVEGLEELKSSVLYHHEKWDGTGYPTGAKGKETPIVARILAVADAFDAMTSTRAYRDELPIEEAFERLEAGIGTQFDPNLAKAIEHAKPAFREIYYDSHDPLDEFEELTDLL